MGESAIRILVKDPDPFSSPHLSILRAKQIKTYSNYKVLSGEGKLCLWQPSLSIKTERAFPRKTYQMVTATELFAILTRKV